MSAFAAHKSLQQVPRQAVLGAGYEGKLEPTHLDIVNRICRPPSYLTLTRSVRVSLHYGLYGLLVCYDIILFYFVLFVLFEYLYK